MLPNRALAGPAFADLVLGRAAPRAPGVLPRPLAFGATAPVLEVRPAVPALEFRPAGPALAFRAAGPGGLVPKPTAAMTRAATTAAHCPNLPFPTERMRPIAVVPLRLRPISGATPERLRQRIPPAPAGGQPYPISEERKQSPGAR